MHGRWCTAWQVPSRYHEKSGEFSIWGTPVSFVLFFPNPTLSKVNQFRELTGANKVHRNELVTFHSFFIFMVLSREFLVLDFNNRRERERGGGVLFTLNPSFKMSFFLLLELFFEFHCIKMHFRFLLQFPCLFFFIIIIYFFNAASDT